MLITYYHQFQINLWDRHGFPECNDSEVYMLCKSSDKTPINPKLDGSLVGDERMRYWEYLKQFISKELLLNDNDDNDDDNDEEDNNNK